MSAILPPRHRIRRDRALVLATGAVLVALAWVVMARMPTHGVAGGHVTSHPSHGVSVRWLAPHAMTFTPAALGLTFAMWLAMLVGMMMPVVLPWVLVLSAAERTRAPGRSPHLSSARFVTGYFAIWSVYSLLGAWLQLLLQQQGGLDAGLATSRAAGAGLLLVAGLFQVSPWKEACLAHCRSPLGFFLERWRDGPSGSFAMGFRHGLYCVACCWALMALMFAAGVMNLAWMAVLAVVMLAEQMAPRRWRLARALGVMLIVWSAALALSTRS